MSLKRLQDIVDEESCKEDSLNLQEINKTLSKITNSNLNSFYIQWIEETNPDLGSIYGASSFLKFLIKQNT